MNIYGTNNDWTPLHNASYSGKLDIVEYLIGKGADIDYQKYDGWSALHLAASCSGRLDVVKYLVENGADIYSKNKNNKTPLDVANTTKIEDFLREIMNNKMIKRAVKPKTKKKQK